MDKLFKALRKQRVEAREVEEELSQLKEEGKLKINGENKKGQGLLQLAISTNNKEIVEVILNQPGIDVNRPDTDSGWTPLIHAILTSADKEIIKQLLRCKIDVNKADNELGYTAAHWAAKTDCVEALQLLYNKSATVVNSVAENSDTPLHVACMDQSDAAAEFLIAKGSNLNAQNIKGETPLHVAVRQQLPNLVLKMLDTNSVDVEANVDVSGNTPLHLAREQNLHALSKLLESRGFSPTIKNKAGLTARDITEHLNEQEKREGGLKTAERKDKQERKLRERDEHMNTTEVATFCKEKDLEDLVNLFYSKKILFLDDYFLQLDENRLRKLGLNQDQRDRFFIALRKREEEIDEEARRLENEQMHAEMMQRRWKQLFGIACIGGAFIFIFLVLKFMERTKKY